MKRGLSQSDLVITAKGFSLPWRFCEAILATVHGGRKMPDKSTVEYFSVQVRLEACFNLVIAAENEKEAIDSAFDQELPVNGMEDFARDVVKVVQLNRRVYVS
jgi:hypothetical protein